MRVVFIIEGSLHNECRVANVGRRDNRRDDGHDGAWCGRNIVACRVFRGPRRLGRPLRIVVPK
jgi:hypothetical protein